MPAYNKPAAQWLGQQLAAVKGTVAANAAQGTEYIVDSSGVCQAIIGHLVAEPNGTATGLEGWGVAVRSATGWISLGADSGWVAPTLLNSWKNCGGSQATAAYRKQGNTVRLRGAIESGASTSIAFVLPEGFAAPYEQTWPVAPTVGASSIVARAQVKPTGEVEIIYEGSGEIRLDVVSFTID
jgi:hypothetical protein